MQRARTAEFPETTEILDLRIFQLKSKNDIAKNIMDSYQNKYSLNELLKKNKD
jgi:hypothetical protein